VTFFSRFNPFRAWRDLRDFLLRRGRIELAALSCAALVTSVIMGVLLRHAAPDVRPARTIIYVQQWPLDRSDDEIKAQQKVDMVARTKAIAEWQARQKKRQAEFKKIDDALRNWGI
jgi:hypothetical protein